MSVGRVTYCTQFDSQYLARGLAMLRSLCRYDRAGSIRILALDELCGTIVREVFAGQVEVVSKEALVDGDGALRRCRDTRSDWEFYATLKPAFLHDTVSRKPYGGRVAYIDADTWFYAPPDDVWSEIGSASIGLSPHSFSEEHLSQRRYGVYNAGFLCFRANETALRCLREWRSDCLGWCGESPTADGRFMNQGYLNSWPARFAGVHVIQHPGYNLAPWNVNGRRLERFGRRMLVDGQPLVFYHFSQTHRDAAGNWYSLQDYFSRQRSLVIEEIYQPYVSAVEDEGLLLLRQSGFTGRNSVRPVTIGPDAICVNPRAPRSGMVPGAGLEPALSLRKNGF